MYFDLLKRIVMSVILSACVTFRSQSACLEEPLVFTMSHSNVPLLQSTCYITSMFSTNIITLSEDMIFAETTNHVYVLPFLDDNISANLPSGRHAIICNTTTIATVTFSNCFERNSSFSPSELLPVLLLEPLTSDPLFVSRLLTNDWDSPAHSDYLKIGKAVARNSIQMLKPSDFIGQPAPDIRASASNTLNALPNAASVDWPLRATLLLHKAEALVQLGETNSGLECIQSILLWSTNSIWHPRCQDILQSLEVFDP